MESPEHRHNVLDPEYREIGVRLAVGRTFAGDTVVLSTVNFGVWR
jgi:uncharacterized protein YkwD